MELPENVLSHLPQINKNAGQQNFKIEHEINIEDTQEMERIMIVDDEPYNINALKIIL